MLFPKLGLTGQDLISYRSVLVVSQVFSLPCLWFGFFPLRNYGVFLPTNPHRPPGVLCHRGVHLQLLHRIRHSNDDWREARVLSQPRRIHLRLAHALRGYRSPIHLHPLHHHNYIYISPITIGISRN